MNVFIESGFIKHVVHDSWAFFILLYDRALANTKSVKRPFMFSGNALEL